MDHQIYSWSLFIVLIQLMDHLQCRRVHAIVFVSIAIPHPSPFMHEIWTHRRVTGSDRSALTCRSRDDHLRIEVKKRGQPGSTSVRTRIFPDNYGAATPSCSVPFVVSLPPGLIKETDNDSRTTIPDRTIAGRQRIWRRAEVRGARSKEPPVDETSMYGWQTGNGPRTPLSWRHVAAPQVLTRGALDATPSCGAVYFVIPTSINAFKLKLTRIKWFPIWFKVVK